MQHRLTYNTTTACLTKQTLSHSDVIREMQNETMPQHNIPRFTSTTSILLHPAHHEPSDTSSHLLLLPDDQRLHNRTNAWPPGTERPRLQDISGICHIATNTCLLRILGAICELIRTNNNFYLLINILNRIIHRYKY